jgi:acyl-[acyl carrier protein]--UDP-N-acetylglucosamine O-acyltransferase
VEAQAAGGGGSVISPHALIGERPEMRGFDGPGIAPAIAADARIEAFVTVDAGVGRATAVGARTWLMKKVHVGHDTVIGADCEIAPLTSIAGHCTIGDRVRIGIGVSIRPYITIGDGARIGAGAAVVKDVPPGEVWAGNPARPLRRSAG